MYIHNIYGQSCFIQAQQEVHQQQADNDQAELVPKRSVVSKQPVKPDGPGKKGKKLAAQQIQQVHSICYICDWKTC